MLLILMSSLRAQNLSWQERQQQEISELRKALDIEEAEETKDVVYEDKKFMKQALNSAGQSFGSSSDGFMEDSISSRLAAPQRKKTSQIESDEQLELLIPKSNPFERKFRKR